MKRSFQVLVLSVLVSATASSCAYQHEKDGGGPQTASPSGKPNGTTFESGPSYAEVREKVFVPRCLNCHSNNRDNTSGVVFESYAETKALIERIRSSTLARRTMPKFGSLTLEESSLLKAWIESGFPETAPSRGPGTPPPVNPSPPSPIPSPSPSISSSPPPGTDRWKWEDCKTKIFKPRCANNEDPHMAGCHVSANRNLHPLVTYEDLTKNNFFVAVFQRALVGKDMPPQGPLSAEEQEKLDRWFRDGLPK